MTEFITPLACFFLATGILAAAEIIEGEVPKQIWTMKNEDFEV